MWPYRIAKVHQIVHVEQLHPQRLQAGPDVGINEVRVEEGAAAGEAEHQTEGGVADERGTEAGPADEGVSGQRVQAPPLEEVDGEEEAAEEEEEEDGKKGFVYIVNGF